MTKLSASSARLRRARPLLAALGATKCGAYCETPRWGVSCTMKDCAGDGPPGRLYKKCPNPRARLRRARPDWLPQTSGLELSTLDFGPCFGLWSFRPRLRDCTQRLWLAGYISHISIAQPI